MNAKGNYVHDDEKSCSLCQFARVCWFFAALCNDDANGNVPLGKSCNRYWSCQGGYPRLQRCPAQLVFDKHSLRCVVPPTEECEVPAIPVNIDEQPNGVNINNNNNNNNEQRGQVRLNHLRFITL